MKTTAELEQAIAKQIAIARCGTEAVMWHDRVAAYRVVALLKRLAQETKPKPTRPPCSECGSERGHWMSCSHYQKHF